MQPRGDGRAGRTAGWRWLGALAAGLLLGCGGSGGPPVPPPDDPRTPGSVDLTVDGTALQASLLLVDRTFSPTECAVVEGSIGQAGLRRLLMFETRVINMGMLDLVIGPPGNPVPPLTDADFEFHGCHGHYHMHGYAAYELLQGGVPVVLGSKQGFCLLDNVRVLPYVRVTSIYTCAYQGLSSGWADIYSRNVDGQWIDVTGVPAGDYVLRVTINAEGRLLEATDVHPNTIEVPVTLPDPSSAATAFVDDHAGTPDDATPIVFPIGLVAQIGVPGDVDMFRVQVTLGERYLFAVELDTLPDSVLRLATLSNTTLDTNDDAGPGDPASRIEWLASFTGPVLLDVRGASGTTGYYRIVADFAP